MENVRKAREIYIVPAPENSELSGGLFEFTASCTREDIFMELDGRM
jgi:hypothetical protein